MKTIAGLGVTVTVIFGLIFFNSLLLKDVIQDVIPVPETSPVKAAPVTPKPLALPFAPFVDSEPLGGIVRKAAVIRGNEFVESRFYQQGRQIAILREYSDGEHVVIGQLPDGKVRFEDSYKKTYGEEFYRDGRLEGSRRTYFEDGSLKSEELFLLGKMYVMKEFYPDGNLRFEVDYSDARLLDGNREVGVGKLYHHNGHLKYEWRLTLSDPVGYRKSYNRDGQLRHADYLDQQGRVIEPAASGM